MGTGRHEFLAMGLFVFTCLLACEPVRRAKECRGISDLVNPTLRAIEAERKRDDAAAYAKIAGLYDGLSVKLLTGKYGTKRLADAVADYARLLSEAARDSRAYSDALAANDVPRSTLARAAAGHTVKREASTLIKIESACASK